ncbi:MAG: DUF4404 family protein [Pseudomonadota bacterium]|nr:DUF4404 family protein [Pseudomonadota bacterium]
MSEQQLQEQLEHLRALVNEIGAERPDSLGRLNRLVSDIEDRLADRGAARPDATDAVREAIRHFEVEHPRATAVLNDIMVTLSNMGI